MAEEIGLQELLHQVKRELLAPSPDDPVPSSTSRGWSWSSACLSASRDRQGSRSMWSMWAARSARSGDTWSGSASSRSTREEMRRLIDADPQLGPRSARAAAGGVVKGLAEES